YDPQRMYQPYKVSGDTVDHSSLGWTFKWDNTRNYIPGSIAKVEIMNPLIPHIDYWQFTTPVLEDNNDLISERLDMINVFPNPYLGQQVEEINAHNRFVTFTHLPEKATVYIFTLAGDLVRKLEHNTPGSSILRWDLLNHANIPVASGMYIAYVELPDGSSKILKLAVFQPEERLDLF
ncbi:MAG: T9SS type A sorting domain-containing protein, partial [Candidatus Marinimicrobia bacterium]|nr:T9SS type A sorting domain-containing protein [Candidatus Neomarinimicrobiota bacterium]